MTTPQRARPVRIGMVGSGFMAREHSAAYRLLTLILGDAVPPVEMVRIAGGRRVHEVGPRYGWRETADDWRAVTEADDIDLVDVVTPNDSHAALTINAAGHGKHVVCEKPLARDTAEAETMRDAVTKAGVHAAVCFVYRCWPAVELARELIAEGRIGRVHGYRGHFLHDHLADRGEPQAWRYDPAKAGSGVLGDIGSHALDLARYLVGDIAQVHCTSRSLLPAGPVPIDDEADLLLRFTDGATGHVWVSWLATGTPMDLGFTVMGDRGAVRFTWARPGELAFYDATAPPALRGYTTIPLGPAHPAGAPYLPVAGAGMGYQQSFVVLLGRFLAAPRGGAPAPTIDEAVTVSRYLDAALASARTDGWSAT